MRRWTGTGRTKGEAVRAKEVAAVVLLVALALAGCSGARDEGDKKPETSTTDQSPQLSTVAPPGIYDLPDGTTQAVGILTHRDLEGGFWAVVNTSVPEGAASAQIVAVVVPPQGIDLQSMSGRFVSVRGKRQEGPSIYQAGPVIDAASVEVVTERR